MDRRGAEKVKMIWVSTTLSCLIGAAALGVGNAQAQAYPSKPVRMIVATGAGSAADGLARLVAQHLGQLWGTSIVVENIPGAGGVVGTQALAKAPADGYTVAILGINHAVNPAIYGKLPYDSVKDFRAVISLTSSTMLIVANASFPANSIADLTALAKAKPTEINYGSPGNGTLPHLVMELYSQQAEVKMTHVPYKALPQMVTDLLAGRISVGSVAGATALPLIKGGRLKALVATSARRSPFFPEVPTGPESGLPGLVVRSWIGMVAPAGTPDAVIAKLYGDISAIVRKKEFEAQLAANGFELNVLDGESFWKNVANEIPLWIRVVKQSGAKLD